MSNEIENWILITPDANWEIFDTEYNGLPLEVKQAMVGGLIEYAPFNRNGFNTFLLGGSCEAVEVHDIICNEEGKLLGQRPNLLASMFYNANHGLDWGEDFLVGNILMRYPPLMRMGTIEEMMTLWGAEWEDMVPQEFLDLHAEKSANWEASE